MDVPNLFGEGINASDFEDYSLARALDKLSEANPKMVFSSVTLQTHGAEEVIYGRLHGDTTSWTFAGMYDENEETPSSQLKIVKLQ
jgi:hypothetical protein